MNETREPSSTVASEPLEAVTGISADAPARCILCGHVFIPGKLAGSLFCPKCGRRFNPNATMAETVSLTPRAEGKPSVSFSDPEAADEKDVEILLAAGDSEFRRFGDYDIISEVARGGMGVVYKAVQRTLKRIVALKVIRGGEGATEEDLERFMREAKAAASLSHPNIVPIHELSVHNGQPFFTMDFIAGTPLDRLIESEELMPYRACEWIETISRAIQYAHEQGIIHRDLKPANIIIDNAGRPMITDFGLAVNLSDDVKSQRMTRTGAVMGTIPYIPPEQASGRVELVDARSDVYSLGAVFYEMLTGRPPFQGDTQFELMQKVIHRNPISPRKLNPKIHPDVETICLKCLEKDPRRRYQSAEELADDCRAFQQGEVIQARPTTMSYKAWRYITRRRTLSGMVGCIVLLSFAFVAQSSQKRKAERKVEKIEQSRQAISNKLEEKEVKLKEKEQELRRIWRQEYTTTFDTLLLHPGARIDGRYVRLLVAKGKLLLSGIPKGQSPHGLFTLLTPFPVDFKLSCQIEVPAENPAALLLLVNSNPRFQNSGTTLTAHLGVPGNPGAKITRGEALLQQDPKFFLTPGVPHIVEMVHAGGKLSVSVDGRKILENDDTAVPGAPERSFLALSAVDGVLWLDKLSVSVRGLSRAMIKSLMEVAGNLMLHRDHHLALKLYERVAIENTRRSTHVTALYGYAKCRARQRRSLLFTRSANAAGKIARYIKDDCSKLIDKMSVTRSVEKGEKEFLIGLTYAHSEIVAVRNGAVIRFREAARKARSKSEPAADSPAPPSLGFYGLLARLEEALVLLRQEQLLGRQPQTKSIRARRQRRIQQAKEQFLVMQRDGSLARLADHYTEEVRACGALTYALNRIDRLLKLGRNVAAHDVATPWSLLEAMRVLYPGSGEDLSPRYYRLAMIQVKQKKSAEAGATMEQAIALAANWYLPRFERARLFFLGGEREQGRLALAAATRELPDSLELQMAIAKFFLDKNQIAKGAYNPLWAYEAAMRAAEISEHLNPEAWELGAKACLLDGRLQEAREAIAQALRLEVTPQRKRLRMIIEQAIQTLSPGEKAATPEGDLPRKDLGRPSWEPSIPPE